LAEAVVVGDLADPGEGFIHARIVAEVQRSAGGAGRGGATPAGGVGVVEIGGVVVGGFDLGGGGGGARA